MSAVTVSVPEQVEPAKRVRYTDLSPGHAVVCVLKPFGKSNADLHTTAKPGLPYTLSVDELKLEVAMKAKPVAFQL
ncbi:hypothetical protein H671_3g8671 [Cricetulus griseus]|uniref:Uncharacterized protein n=1 Tax=Cricetulus griseus TaxID=10029 RepID=A0A061II02_CRIGR|nr:hypothetical protein H671_3g8671 [Cricetulus griseus]